MRRRATVTKKKKPVNRSKRTISVACKNCFFFVPIDDSQYGNCHGAPPTLMSDLKPRFPMLHESCRGCKAYKKG